MTLVELERLVNEFMSEKFDSLVRGDIDNWLKENGFIKMEFSMGGYVFTKTDGETIVDEDLRDSDSPTHKQFYKDYIESLVYAGKNTSILYALY